MKEKNETKEKQQAMKNKEEITEFDELHEKKETESEEKKRESEQTNTESDEKKQELKEKTDEAEKKAEKSEEKKAEAESKTEKSEEKKAEAENKTEKSEEKKAEAESKTEKSEEKKAEAENKTEKSEEKKADTENKTEKSEDSGKAISASKKLADARASQKQETAAKKEESTEKEKTAHAKKKKPLWIACGCLVAVLLVAYISGAVYFSRHFYKNVTINGVDVSGMDRTEAKDTLDRFYQNYALQLILIDGSEERIYGNDIDMKIALRDEFSDCYEKQTAALWFVKMSKTYAFEMHADTSWDEDALEKLYDDFDFLKEKNMEEPGDAYVGVVDGEFAIVREVEGSTVKPAAFQQAVEESLREVIAELDLKEAGCYELPAVYEDDDELAKELDAKNEYAKNDIKLQLDDLTLEPGMELYEAVLEKKGDSYEVSEKKVQKYVKKLAEQYDTLGTDRTFTTSWDDKKIQTHGEAFGYVMNQEETEKALLKALEAKKSTTVEVTFDQKGYTLQGENDIGDTYIEVNLSEQHVIGYKDGKKLVEGDCVSGNESAGHGTCIGLYAIQAKLSPTVLRGEKKPVTKTVTKKNKKGKKVKVEETTYEYEYESPVTYWMQFNGGIGLHDAAGWRSVYGGSIYYYSGSHGCVNLPLDLAKTLYENFDLNTPVIVYFWDNENRK